MKQQKEEAILFFLKKYGILIDFEDESYLDFKKRVSLGSEPTFKAWKDATFENGSADIIVYGGHKPTNNTKFNNIIKENNAKNLLKVLGHFRNKLDEDNQEYISAEKKKLEKFPKRLLEECIEEQMENGGLEVSVSDFFKRWVDDPSNEVETKEILTRLIQVYNSSVKKFRNKI